MHGLITAAPELSDELLVVGVVPYDALLTVVVVLLALLEKAVVWLALLKVDAGQSTQLGCVVIFLALQLPVVLLNPIIRSRMLLVEESTTTLVLLQPPKRYIR